ncbi:hypothetical protein S83_069006, partial [Arachis hypogaea]
KFAQGSSNLDKLLASQRPLFEKSGLGYIAKEDVVSNTSSIKFVASSSNTKSIPNKSGIGYVSKCEEKSDEEYTNVAEPSPRTGPSSNRPGLGYISKNEAAFKKPTFHNKTSFSKGKNIQKNSGENAFAKRNNFTKNQFVKRNASPPRTRKFQNFNHFKQYNSHQFQQHTPENH